jgi:hypothetical protein
VIRAIRQKTLPAAATAIAAVALAAPPAASAATLGVDPVRACYRETDTIFLSAQGYTPNGFVDFTRDGNLIERLQADASGAISGDLTLPGLLSGRRRLTYVGTDAADPSVQAQVTLLATATDVRVTPRSGAANRRLTIAARGFFGRGSRTLWAHVVRLGGGARAAAARTVRIGRVRGACQRVRTRKRLFRAGAAAGRYRVQFDKFRRFRAKRKVEYDDLIVTISR